jgi:hypothetical protein
MKKLGIVLILSILLVSCSNREPVGKYQAVEVAGELIIIDTTNGEGEVFTLRVVEDNFNMIKIGKVSRPKK